MKKILIVNGSKRRKGNSYALEARIAEQLQGKAEVTCFNIGEKDSLEIYVDGDSIILRKYQATCVFCESAKKIVNYRGKNVCPDCIAKLKELY